MTGTHGSEGASAGKPAGATRLGHDHLGGALADSRDRHQPGDDRRERRGRLRDQRVQLGDLDGEVIVGVQVQPAHLAVAAGEPAVAGHLQVIGLAAEHPLGQVRQPPGVAFPGDQRLDHLPPGLAQQPAGHRVDLDPGVFQHLGQPLALGGALLDQPLAVPGPLPQRRHLGRRDETGPQQPVLVQLSDPLAVRDIPLAARDIPHMRRVAHAHLDPATSQGMVDRPPVHPGAFHRRVRDAQLCQPGRHLLQWPPERLEPLGDHLPLTGRLARQPDRDPDHLLVHVDSRDARMDDIHRYLPAVPPGTGYGRAPPAEPATRSRSCNARS